jgi:Sigma-70, region 4
VRSPNQWRLPLLVSAAEDAAARTPGEELQLLSVVSSLHSWIGLGQRETRPPGAKAAHIVKARSGGVTLAEIGKSLGISAERVRQREAQALSQIKGLMASFTVVDLVSRGNTIRFPVERTQQWADFRDREPPKHIYCEPKPSRELAHHRAKASYLAALRGNAPLRNSRGPYGGPLIHAWGRA